MMLTFKRKLILTKAQEQRIRSWIGACRVVYNLGLEIRQAAYKGSESSVHKYELMKQITAIRQDYNWIEDVPVGSLQDAIERLDLAYKTFFRTYQLGGGFPKYASKRVFTSIKIKHNVSLKKNAVRLPKIGWLKMIKDSPVLGDIKNAIIKIEPTGFFISIVCDNVPPKFQSENQTLGIDMGISHFAVDSSGCFIENPKHFKKYEDKLRIENRSLARKKKGSNSWKRQVKRLGLLHHKIGNVRKDFLHKESTKIAKENSIVYLEDLNIKGMVKNKNLSKHILDCGWGIFKQMLSYKTNVVFVDAKYTSQTCNVCGHKDKASRKSQSLFICTSCGHEDNADLNAAHNIKSRGTTLSRKRSSREQALALKSTNKDIVG